MPRQPSRPRRAHGVAATFATVEITQIHASLFDYRFRRRPRRGPPLPDGVAAPGPRRPRRPRSPRRSPRRCRGRRRRSGLCLATTAATAPRNAQQRRTGDQARARTSPTRAAPRIMDDVAFFEMPHRPSHDPPLRRKSRRGVCVTKRPLRPPSNTHYERSMHPRHFGDERSNVSGAPRDTTGLALQYTQRSLLRLGRRRYWRFRIRIEEKTSDRRFSGPRTTGGTAMPCPRRAP